MIIYDLREDYKVSRLCRYLNVSKSGYYRWLERGRPIRYSFDEKLADMIEEIFYETKKGYRFIRDEIIRRYGVLYNDKTVFFHRFNLARRNADDLSVTWHSSDETVMTATGLTTLPATPQQITLTAHCDGQQDRTFNVTVHPRNAAQCLTLYYPFEVEDANESGQGDLLLMAAAGTEEGQQSWRAATATLIGGGSIDGTLNLTSNTATGFATNGYLMLPQGLLDEMRSFTVAARIKPKTVTKLQRLFDFGSGSQNSIFGRIDKLAIGEKYKGATTQLITSTRQLTANREYQVAFTFDAASHEAKVFIDGEQVARGTFAQEPWELAAYAANVRNYIGRTQWWDTSSATSNIDFCGTIDDLRLFSIALNADELKNIDDIMTGVNNEELRVKNEESGMKDEGWFDLSGRRMARPSKRGIYISNHKKRIQ